jgi:hypothetical protein
MATTTLTSAFISLNDVINNFLIAYTGPGKMIPDAKRTEVIFHARRCLQEFAYDTLKAQFSEDFNLSNSAVPGDGQSANPFKQPADNVSVISIKRSAAAGGTTATVSMTEVATAALIVNNDQYFIDYTAKTVLFNAALADVANGYFISYTYLSNALTTDENAAIPKLAEEALYACMIYSIMSNRDNPDPNTLQRLLISKIALLDLSKSRLVFTNFT